MPPMLDLENRVCALEAETRELRRALNRTIKLLRMTASASLDRHNPDPKLQNWLDTPTWGEEPLRTLAELGDPK